MIVLAIFGVVSGPLGWVSLATVTTNSAISSAIAGFTLE